VTQQLRYFCLFAAWLALFTLPMMAGDWWDDHYHVSLTSLAVIALARKLYPHAWWADFLGVVAMLQIVHAVADYTQPGTPEVYDWIQASFNAMELGFLAIGAFSEWLGGRNNAFSNSRPRSDIDAGNSQGKRHA
jgi:hypothetical protein